MRGEERTHAGFGEPLGAGEIDEVQLRRADELLAALRKHSSLHSTPQRTALPHTEVNTVYGTGRQRQAHAAHE